VSIDQSKDQLEHATRVRSPRLDAPPPAAAPPARSLSARLLDGAGWVRLRIVCDFLALLAGSRCCCCIRAGATSWAGASSCSTMGDRHRVRAGITGWAQIHGLRGQTGLADRVEFDNFYIEHWSRSLDLKIMFLTIPALLRGS